MTITAASAKAKGRRFQQEVIRLLARIVGLDLNDMESRPGGQQGEDIILGTASRSRFPYSIECKHRKSYKELYTAYDQAVVNTPKGAEPLLCLRTDRRKPLAIVDLEHFLAMTLDLYTLGRRL